MGSKLICAATFLVAFSIAAVAADVSGKWVAELQGRRGSSGITFTFKASGGELSGTISTTGGDIPISDGRIEDDKITFKVVREFQGNTFTTNYAGTVSGNEIRFTVSNGRGSTQELVARRSD
jgi:opacity protein-like surface antigen